ncbi:MAG: AMP-binding protein, partial [Alloalcanivorax venustensis]
MTATETTPTLLHGCDTVVKLWRQQCLERGERIAHREKDLGIWQSYSWRDYYEHARAIGVALLSMGLERGQPVSILSEDNKEWLYCDLGIAGAGGISNGVYTTDSAEQLAYLVNDSGSAFLFVENDEQLDKYMTVRDQVPTLKKVIVFDRKGLRDFQDPMVMFLDELYELGNGIADAEERFSASIAMSQPDDIRMLIYTSGTTGAPKGAMISHQNVLFQMAAGEALLEARQEDDQLCFLPL